MMQNLENEGEEELERGDKQQISPSSSSEGVHKEMNTNSAPSKTKVRKGERGGEREGRGEGGEGKGREGKGRKGGEGKGEEGEVV